MRILVVDDEPSFARCIQRALRRHQVTIAEDGRAALDLLVSGARFDAVLCDLAMPGVGGEEVYEALRRMAPGMERRIVFMTGGAFDDRGLRFLERVPNRHIHKPFDLEDLEDLLRDAA